MRRLVERRAPQQLPPAPVRERPRAGELGLKHVYLSLKSRCARLMALGIVLPFKRLSMKEVRLVKVVVRIRPKFFD